MDGAGEAVDGAGEAVDGAGDAVEGAGEAGAGSGVAVGWLMEPGLLVGLGEPSEPAELPFAVGALPVVPLLPAGVVPWSVWLVSWLPDCAPAWLPEPAPLPA